jgi:hypothetical protein
MCSAISRTAARWSREKAQDFLILDADPLADIPNTTRHAAVYRADKRVEPKFQEEFTPSTSPGP